jgi:hypothetical protein
VLQQQRLLVTRGQHLRRRHGSSRCRACRRPTPTRTPPCCRLRLCFLSSCGSRPCSRHLLRYSEAARAAGGGGCQALVGALQLCCQLLLQLHQLLV